MRPWLDRLRRGVAHPELDSIESEVERLRAEQRDIAARLERLELELEVIRRDVAE